MDTIGYLIHRVPAGTGGGNDAFHDLRPLGAGPMSLALTSDLNTLGLEASYRTLASLPGFDDISRDSPTTYRGTDSRFSDYDWFSPLVTPPSGAGDHCANACFGSHVIHRVAGAGAAWPVLTLRGRVSPPAGAGAYIHAILIASRGVGAFPTSADAYATTRVEGGAGWKDLTLTLALDDAMVEPRADLVTLGNGGSSGAGVLAEHLVWQACTFWCAFYSESGKCSAVALTLGLEPA